MEGNEISKINRVLSVLKEKYKQTDNLMAFTKEMEKVIEINDLEALGAVLTMRQETMERIDKLNFDISGALAEMDRLDSDKIKRLLKQTDVPVELDDPLEAGIFNTNKMTLMLLQKIIALDEAINKKIQKAG